MAHARLGAFVPDAGRAGATQQCGRLAARHRADLAARRDKAGGRAELLSELREFADPLFNADRYIQRHMGASARDTRTFIVHLLMLRDFAREQLQRKAYLSLPTALRAAQLVGTAERDLHAIERSLVALQKLIARLSNLDFPERTSTAAPAGGTESDPADEKLALGLGLLPLPPVAPGPGPSPPGLSAAQTDALAAVEVAIVEGNLAHAVDLFLQLQREVGEDKATALLPMQGALYTAITDRLAGPEPLYLFDQHLELLLRLDRLEAAAALFLRQRSAVLRDALDKVTFAGDFHLYVKRSASLFFLLLRLSSNHYRKLFGNLRLATLVRWLVAETDGFALLLRPRILQADAYRHAVRGCRTAFGCCQRFEVTVGVPVLARFQAFFLPGLAALVKHHFADLQRDVLSHAAADPLEPLALPLPAALFPTADGPGGEEAAGPPVTVSAGCQALLQTVQAEVVHTLLLQHPTCHWYEEGLQAVIEAYLEALQAYLSEPSHKDLQCLVCIANATFVADHLLPGLAECLRARFQLRSLPRLDPLAEAAEGLRPRLLEALVAAKCAAFRRRLTPDVGPREASATPEEDVRVSRSMTELVLYVPALAGLLRQHLGADAAPVLAGVLAGLAVDFAQEEYWVETYKHHYLQQAPKAPMTTDQLALADAYQVFLDVDLFLCAFAKALPKAAAGTLRALQGALLRRHFKQAATAERKEAEFRSLASEVIVKTLKGNPKLDEAIRKGTAPS